jgi:GMP synthase (glutamine-hydrolysing)
VSVAAVGPGADARPVLVLQHLNEDGPAYLGRWLDARAVPWTVRNTEAGDVFPADMAPYRALAVLGGEMGANDPLPSLRQAEVLIRDAMTRGRPVIGHCLGGQLMARALGAQVGPSPAPEIGWAPVAAVPGAAARAWFGDDLPPRVFQWHYDAFALPAGAELLATSAACAHQAFSVDGRHLALQFHVELDAPKLARWAAADDARYRAAQALHATVQSPTAMGEHAALRLAAQQRLADRLYARWLSGCQGR